MLAGQRSREPFLDQPLARPRDRIDAGLQRRRDLAVAPALTAVRGVSFQQNPGLQHLLRRMFAGMDQGGELLTLVIAERHDVFLYGDLFAGHDSTPPLGRGPWNQRNMAKSMTGATRGEAARYVECAEERDKGFAPYFAIDGSVGERTGSLTQRNFLDRHKVKDHAANGRVQPNPGMLNMPLGASPAKDPMRNKRIARAARTQE